jgi:hypothetical protein
VLDTVTALASAIANGGPSFNSAFDSVITALAGQVHSTAGQPYDLTSSSTVSGIASAAGAALDQSTLDQIAGSNALLAQLAQSATDGASVFAQASAVAAMAQQSIFVASATDQWIDHTGSWAVAANWSNGAVPDATTDAFLNLAHGTTVTVSGPTHYAVNHLVSVGDGTLKIDGIQLNGPTLTANANSDVSNLLLWDNSELSVIGDLTVTGSAQTRNFATARASHNLTISGSTVNFSVFGGSSYEAQQGDLTLSGGIQGSFTASTSASMSAGRDVTISSPIGVNFSNDDGTIGAGRNLIPLPHQNDLAI